MTWRERSIRPKPSPALSVGVHRSLSLQNAREGQMADSRPVPSNLLSWPGIAKLLPDQKLIATYLWFNRFTKACGCYEFPRQMATVELSISDAALDDALLDFQRRDIIDLDETTGELYVMAWPRFHKFKNVVQQVMYWTSVGQIQSDRLARLVIDRTAQSVPCPANSLKPYGSRGCNPTRTATATATATKTKPEATQAGRGAIPAASRQRLMQLGYFLKNAA